MKLNVNNPRQILRDVEVGEGSKIYDFVNAYECSIGSYSKVGTFVEIQRNSSIGNNCKISSHSFICEGVEIQDDVFIGHNVSFINDLFPSATNIDGSRQEDGDWEVSKTLVMKGSSIGTSATILAGVRIGLNSLVGAGSVVVGNVPDFAIVAGNPAKVLRYYNKH